MITKNEKVLNFIWNRGDVPYFPGYEMHFPPKIWEEGGGASYSPNVAYLARYRISALKDVIKNSTTFFASKMFPLFSSSKT